MPEPMHQLKNTDAIVAHVDDPNGDKEDFIEKIPKKVIDKAIQESIEKNRQVPLVYYQGYERVVIGTATVTQAGVVALVHSDSRGGLARQLHEKNLTAVSLSFEMPVRNFREDILFEYPPIKSHIPDPDTMNWAGKAFLTEKPADRLLPEDPAYD